MLWSQIPPETRELTPMAARCESYPRFTLAHSRRPQPPGCMEAHWRCYMTQMITVIITIISLACSGGASATPSTRPQDWLASPQT